MILTLIILIIASNAVTNDKRKSIIFSRLTMQGLILSFYISQNNLFIKPLTAGLGLYGGMFNINAFTQSFNIFIISMVIVIILLTSFHPRIIHSYSLSHEKYINDTTVNDINTTNTYMYDEEYNINKISGQFSIIEYALIILFVLCGAILLMSTGDLISMFLSIELQSYGLYILCTLHRDSESSTSSGLTYFLLGGMSSCFILLGSALLYVNTGTTNLDNIYIISSLTEVLNIHNHSSLDNIIASHNSEGLFSITPLEYKSYYIGISLIIMIVGFLFKVSAAPFHFWSPDVYDGIPTIVTTFVAVIAKISIFVFILQLVSNIDFNLYLDNAYSFDGEFYVKWKNILIFSSFMSLIIGSILGLTQYRIKRLFAYSTISHVGFILLALSVGSIESVQAYIFYILQYTVSNINAFFILIAIGFTINYGNNLKSNIMKNDILMDLENSPVQLISQLKGYFYVNPFTCLSLAITLFSFVGVPPLMGFFAKQMVLSAALDEGFVFITLVGIITSVIGAVYYLNVIRTMFFAGNDNIKYNPLLLLNNSDIFNQKLSSLYFRGNIIINNALSLSVSVLTIIILTFMSVPNEWLRVASILSTSLFNF